MNKTRFIVAAWIALTIVMLAGAYAIVERNRPVSPGDAPSVYSH